MPPKDKKGKSSTLATGASTFGESEQTVVSPRSVHLVLELIGDPPGPGEWTFVTLFNKQIILDGKWQNGVTLASEYLPLDLKDPYYSGLCADQPLIFLLRQIAGKSAKDPDPLLSTDNRAGATVDLFPLVLGEQKIFTEVTLLNILTEERTDCIVQVTAESHGTIEPINEIPLLLTMISAHCLPLAKEGTVYLGAVGLDGVCSSVAVNFGNSLSNADATKLVWGAVSNAGYAANSAMNVPDEDSFIPQDLEPSPSQEGCICMYWNCIKRVLVDSAIFRDRLNTPFMIEVAGVPRTGKIDVRGRYMACFDAKVLLEPGERGVTGCARLLFYNEAEICADVGALLELPPTSAKTVVRDSDYVFDEFGHPAYIKFRMDLTESLVSKAKITRLFELIGFAPPEGPSGAVEDLEAQPVPEDPTIDVRRIRKEGGALSVHNELSGLACRGAVPMNQGIKRTAANRLLMRVRSMLKQFPPGNCSEIDWQDIVSGQHAASRRAVASSFAPQPPPLRQPPKEAAARCRIAGDLRIAEKYVKANLKVNQFHPRSLLSKAIRCLEQRHDTEAKHYILEGLRAQTRNRFLLWIYGAHEFNRGEDAAKIAVAAFRISVKGDYSEGTANAIGWAALHALHHSRNNSYASFVAARKMRKSYELPRDWKKLIERWVKTSGEEEVFWIPTNVSDENPVLIAAAFFLCLRSYDFSDRLLKCYEFGCGTRGSRKDKTTKVVPDLYYLRAASYILRRNFEKALSIVNNGIKVLGPSPILSQMRVNCLMCIKGWDGKCAVALKDADKAGSEICPSILLRAALGGFKIDPVAALQRAARAHKLAPSGHSALTIGRIYAVLGEDALAERWASVAVKVEPLLADGWAFLSLLAMYQRSLDKARAMIRTARQVGPISPDIEEEWKKIKDMLQLETLPDTLVKNLCFCEYY